MTAVETHSLPGLVTLLGEIFPPGSVFPVEERVTGEHHLLIGLVSQPPIPPVQLATRIEGLGAEPRPAPPAPRRIP